MGDNKENKRITEEEQSNTVVTEESNMDSKDKKSSRESRRKATEEEIRKAKEEIEKLLEQMEEQTGIKKDDVRVIKIRTPKKTFKAVVLNALYSILINTVLIVSLSGYLVWSKSATPLQLVYFALMYTGFELLFRNVLVLFFYKWIFKTMGLVLALPGFLAVLASILVGSTYVAITSTSMVLVLFLLLFVVRQLFNRMINNYRRR